LDFAETDQGTRNALVAAISDQATAEVTAREPTEQELHSYYLQHPGRWATEGVMTFRHFEHAIAPGHDTAGALASATAAAEAMRRGTHIEDVLTQFGFKETQSQRDEYYFTVKYRIGDNLFQAIEGLGDGEFSQPIASGGAVHIIEMIENKKPVPLDFRVARSQVLTDFNEASRTRVRDNAVKFLRSKATVLIAPDYAFDYKPTITKSE